tara:strand:+ start:251 stop:1768 length:1518 start_codon:yes stop_codon:yes gene_type:complete
VPKDVLNLYNRDFVIVSSPILNTYFPPPAPAVLKACLEEAGISCAAYDLSINLRTDLVNQWSVYTDLDFYFQLQLNIRYSDISDVIQILDNKRKTLKPEVDQIYDSLLEKYAQRMLSYNSSWLGVSVLSINSIVFTYDLIRKIRQLKSDAKIVLGGPGLAEQAHGHNRSALKFGDILEQSGMCDYVIYGEGERAIVELANNIMPDRNQGQIVDINNLPYPDYTDYDMDQYISPVKIYSITGSRGCVRNCAFCDIKFMWNKFVYRTGKNIADELVHHYQNAGITEFNFTDSLVNGNVRELKELCKHIVDYKTQGILPNNLVLRGQFICRPKNQMKEQDFKMLADAGFDELYIGIESGSTKVLHSMGKKYSREDIDYTMTYLDKYRIKIRFMLILGFPTESHEDFYMTLDMLKDYKKYSDRGTIVSVNLSKTMAILENSPVGQQPSNWGVMFSETGSWETDNSNNRERCSRRYEAQLVCEEMGYNIEWSKLHMDTIAQSLTSGTSNV